MNQQEIKFNKLLILDPVCVFSYGHNVSAMVNFRNLLSKYFNEIICIGSNLLPDLIAEEINIKKLFAYNYNNVMPVDLNIQCDGLPESHNEKIKSACDDFLSILEKYEIGEMDSLCYPSIDFYALIALNKSIDLIKSKGNPKIYIRLIGVMEMASDVNYAKPHSVIIAIINSLYEAGLRVHLAAETPRYADYLAVNINKIVSVAANIESRDYIPLPEGKPFSVICPGSARYDKGFLMLHQIFSRVRELDPNINIVFSTQILPDRDLKFQLDYLIKLYSIPGVTILPAKLAKEELENIYKSSDLVLLPYAKDVYHHRGSAVLIESLCSGRHCLTFDGPAFVDQIRFFGGGYVCANAIEMADKIIEYSKEPVSSRRARALQARSRFILDLEISYENWIN